MTSLRKLFLYFFTAGTAAVVDVGGFALLCLTPVPIAASAASSFCVAAVVNYMLTSCYVFNQTPTARGFGLFFVTAVGGLSVNVSVTLIGSMFFGVVPVLAKVLGVGTAFLLNFWLNLRIVFRPPSAGPTR
jgi:putative flippase GtrA